MNRRLLVQVSAACDHSELMLRIAAGPVLGRFGLRNRDPRILSGASWPPKSAPRNRGSDDNYRRWLEGARNLARARRPAALILCAARAEAARARGARPSARCCGGRFCRATRARALAHVRRLARSSAHTLPRLAPAPGSLPRSRLTSTPTHQPAPHPFRSVLRTHPRTQLASSWRAADAPSARIESHARAQGRAHDT